MEKLKNIEEMENTKKLYLTGWELNAYKIINKLAEIIKKDGGFPVYEKKFINLYKREKYLVKNRHIDNDIMELKETIKTASENIKKGIVKAENIEKVKEYIKNKKKELKELKKIDNSFKLYNFKNYLHFYLNNYIIYVELNDNPFFEFYLSKEPATVQNDTIVTNFSYYMDHLNKNFIDDYEKINSYYETTNEDQIEEITQRLFNQIKNAEPSEIVKDKIRVNNLYNNGWYYETIKKEFKKEYVKIEV